MLVALEQALGLPLVPVPKQTFHPNGAEAGLLLVHALMEIVKKSSGKKKGQPRISKRGRRKLRRTMYESARALMTWNPAFQDVFLYYRSRTKKPLGGMQAKIAVACKAIRIFYVVLKTGCDFDEEKFRKDIIRPEAA